MINWHESYLGLPYSKYNCGALVQKILFDEFSYFLDIRNNRDLSLDLQARAEHMVIKSSDFIKIDKPIDKCVVLMYTHNNMVGHVGVYVSIGAGYILHTTKAYGFSILEPLNQVLKKNKLYGYFICK
jgi:hypothetical protein